MRGYHLTDSAVSNRLSTGWVAAQRDCGHYDHHYSCVGDVLPESEADGAQNQIADVLHVYRIDSVSTFPGIWGLIIGIPIFVFLLDILDVNKMEKTEEPVRVETKL